MAVTTIDCFVGAELNETRLEIGQAGAAVGSEWMGLITRVVLRFGGVVIDTDEDTSGAIDFSTGAEDSVISLKLGLAIVNGTAPPEGVYPARLDIYHGTDNAVIAHDSMPTLRVRVLPEVPA